MMHCFLSQGLTILTQRESPILVRLKSRASLKINHHLLSQKCLTNSASAQFYLSFANQGAALGTTANLMSSKASSTFLCFWSCWTTQLSTRWQLLSGTLGRFSTSSKVCPLLLSFHRILLVKHSSSSVPLSVDTNALWYLKQRAKMSFRSKILPRFTSGNTSD